MNKKLKSSILYNYAGLNYKVIGILCFILSLFTIYELNTFIELNDNISTQSKNAWDFYAFAYIDGSIFVSVLIFLSLYIIFSCFKSNQKEMFLKIRNGNWFIWFTAKIISIFIANFMVITLSTILVIIIGIVVLGNGIGWSKLAFIMRPYAKSYNPLEFALLNIITYSFFLTFLSEIIGVLLIKFNKIKVGIATIVYIALDRYIFSFPEKVEKVLKYFSLSSYVNFGNRPYYQSVIDYISVKEGIILPIIFAVLTFIFIGYINKGKRFIM